MTWLFLGRAEADGFRVCEPEEVGGETIWRHDGGNGEHRATHLRVPVNQVYQQS